MWDVAFGGAVLHNNVSDRLLGAVRAGLGESGVWALNDGMVCQGQADMAIGVYVGNVMVYAFPIGAHGSKISPATIFGDAETAPVFYAEISASDARDSIRRNPDNAARYSFTHGGDYAVKVNRSGAPISRKFTLARFARMVSTCVEMHVYNAFHATSIDWRAARNLAIKCRPVRDLQIN